MSYIHDPCTKVLHQPIPLASPMEDLEGIEGTHSGPNIWKVSRDIAYSYKVVLLIYPLKRGPLLLVR